MLSNEQIASLISERLDHHKKSVLATVVLVKGSAYRREGAKMLIDENGDFYGMISGGCLEADVVEEAKKVLEKNKPTLKKYVLDEDLVWGLGLGCPGVVEIYLEPIEHTSAFWSIWTQQINASQPFVACKILSEKTVTWGNLIVTEMGTTGQWDFSSLQNEVVSSAIRKLVEKESNSESFFINTINGETQVFLDVYQPPPHLCIFGAGHDAIPVAQLAFQLGYQTTVIDSRPAFNTQERFPYAERLIMQPKDVENGFLINSNTAIVIMNHHLERDMDTLAVALKSQASYVGLLGPRKRREKMISSLRDLGIIFSKEELEKLHSPIGLDIGADTSEEIALSIMAELVAFRKGHNGGFLKDSYFIHKQPALEEQR